MRLCGAFMMHARRRAGRQGEGVGLELCRSGSCTVTGRFAVPCRSKCEASW